MESDSIDVSELLRRLEQKVAGHRPTSEAITPPQPAGVAPDDYPPASPQSAPAPPQSPFAQLQSRIERLRTRPAQDGQTSPVRTGIHRSKWLDSASHLLHRTAEVPTSSNSPSMEELLVDLAQAGKTLETHLAAFCSQLSELATQTNVELTKMADRIEDLGSKLAEQSSRQS